MRASLFLTALLAPLTSFSAPAPENAAISARQAVVKPRPCQPIVPDPTKKETECRHFKFAYEFIITKNITAAFEFISEGYINHNPLAKNGFDSAWNLLSPIWGNFTIEPLGVRFISPQGWLNYNTTFGTIVDRFRWEGGCIAEHWDQNETFPAY